MTQLLQRQARLWFGMALMVVSLSAIGCERDEKLLDIETQNSDVEVERDADDGGVKVDVD